MAFTRTPFDDWMDTQAALTDGKWFYARLAGSTHVNDDGSARQAAIATLHPREELQLAHEPDNAFDPNAVRVLTGGRQIGYLEARLAGETVRRTKKRTVTRAFVSNITGGRNGQPLGCTLAILVYAPA